MKKFKKLFLVVSIVAILMVMMVVSVSAEESSCSLRVNNNPTLDDLASVEMESEYVVFLQPQDYSTPMNECKIIAYSISKLDLLDGFVFTSYCDVMVNYLIDNWSSVSNNLSLTPENLWNRFEYYCMNVETLLDENSNAIGFKPYLDNFSYIYYMDISSIASSESFSYNLAFREGYSEESVYPGIVNHSFPLTMDNCINFSELFIENYKHLLDSKTITTLEGQVTELNTTITEKDAVITEKDTAISTLQGENANLQIDVDSLNTQVENLVEEKTVIDSELKALEAKMEREIDKAYEQGYEDADGFNFMPIIACLSVVVLIVTIISFVVTNKRKKRR